MLGPAWPQDTGKGIDRRFRAHDEIVVMAGSRCGLPLSFRMATNVGLAMSGPWCPVHQSRRQGTFWTAPNCVHRFIVGRMWRPAVRWRDRHAPMHRRSRASWESRWRRRLLSRLAPSSRDYGHLLSALSQVQLAAAGCPEKFRHHAVWRLAETGVIEERSTGHRGSAETSKYFNDRHLQVRGALNCAEALEPSRTRSRRVVAVSAGNHRDCRCLDGEMLDISDQVVMPQHASPARNSRVQGIGRGWNWCRCCSSGFHAQ